MSLISAQSQLADLGVKAQKVFEDSSLTVAEKAAAMDLIEADIKSAKAEIALHDRIQSYGIGQAEDIRGEGVEAKSADEHSFGAKSIGQQVLESTAYKSAVANLEGRMRFGTVTEVKGLGLKAAATIDEGSVPAFSGGAGLGGQLVAPQFLPGIVPLKFQPLTIADLLASGTTNAPAVTYVVESAFNDNTATVAEKGKKPQLDLSLARRQDPVVKIANIAKITDEMLQDAPAFEAYLTNRMTFALARAEEAQLLNGNGTLPNMQGLMNRPGVLTNATTAGATATKTMENLFDSITKLRTTSFVEPDAVVMNPADWETIRLAKDANGQYFAGGPFTGAYGNPGPSNIYSIWGLRVVVTAAMPAGSYLMGGFQECAQVFRRQGVVVEMTNSNVDDFENNLITLRSEERLALAVYRPAGFIKGTITA